MGDIVNLRQRRKRKARDEKTKKADANRIAFGRRREERQKSKSLQDMEDRKLAAHCLMQHADQIEGEADEKGDEKGDVVPKRDAPVEAKAVKNPKDAKNAPAPEDHPAVLVSEKTSDSDEKRQPATKNTDGDSNVVSLKPGHSKK